MPKNNRLVREIAGERVDILLDLAASPSTRKYDADGRLAKRYARLAHEIITHYKIRSGRYRREVCRKCFAILVPGKTCKVVMASSRRQMIYTCTVCGTEKKIHY